MWNELSLDFMGRLAAERERAAQQEGLLRHTIDRLQREKRELERQLEGRDAAVSG